MRFLISPQYPVAAPCSLERSPSLLLLAADLPPSVLRSAAGLLLLILHTFVHPSFFSTSLAAVLAGLGLYTHDRSYHFIPRRTSDVVGGIF